MAYKINKDKAALAAAEWMTNGNDDIKALLSIGYDAKYVSNHHKTLWQNMDIQSAISKIKAVNAVKTSITVASIQSELEQVQADAKAKGDIQGQLRALELKGKTIAAYSDNLNTNDLTQQVALEAIDRLEAERIANIRLSKAV